MDTNKIVEISEEIKLEKEGIDNLNDMLSKVTVGSSFWLGCVDCEEESLDEIPNLASEVINLVLKKRQERLNNLLDELKIIMIS